MIKILFICHGNICRSPMAEFVMKDLVKKQGLEQEFEIASCATSTEKIWNGIGNPVYPPAREELARHGISCGSKRALQLTNSDYDYYDYLVCMDSRNVRNAARITGRSDKYTMLLEYTGENRDVADPWYTGDFGTTYKDVLAGCEALLEHIIRLNGSTNM